MKKSKLKIENLKVQSFVTTMEVGKVNTVKGGLTCQTVCNCNGDDGTGPGPTPGPTTTRVMF